MDTFEIGKARGRMMKAKEAYDRAKCQWMCARDEYHELVDKWWREALKESETRLSLLEGQQK